MIQWPTQSECDDFYGNPRDPSDPTQASAKWVSDNIVIIKTPFTLTYTGHPVVSIRCHRLVADALTGVLEEVRDAASNDQATLDAWGISIFGGSYNYRLMRGLNTLSMHSYGCAFDFDPARNVLGDHNPHFKLCDAVLNAWNDHGAMWGGSWPTRPDGMHWQFARVS